MFETQPRTLLQSLFTFARNVRIYMVACSLACVLPSRAKNPHTFYLALERQKYAMPEVVDRLRKELATPVLHATFLHPLLMYFKVVRKPEEIMTTNDNTQTCTCKDYVHAFLNTPRRFFSSDISNPEILVIHICNIHMEMIVLLKSF